MATAFATDARTRAADKLYRRRRVVNVIALALACAAAVFGLAFLGWILWTLLVKGLGGVNLDLFIRDQPPPMEAGGLRNAIFGSIAMCTMGLLIGTPLGIAAGTWLAEYGNKRKFGTVVRFVNDILLSAPSIVLGLFVYAVFVAKPTPDSNALLGFSALSGAIALAFIVLPVVVRTTDEMLRLVPGQMREAALSLGVPQWKVIVQVLYKSALPGIVTGVLLALARISGETAPLLFTAFGNSFWTVDVTGPMAAVSIVMFNFAGKGYENWEHIAWAGALVVTAFVLLVSLVARALLLRNKISHD
ncbi:MULTISPECIES: phosphate ABC transporter permease PstA [Lysobacter]|uniref:phosphate ABC transporter permease PstA n=1 Tax=Lysobacter TaxID=68 RepID=UPI001F3E67CA|nr:MULTISPECIES: phosphate ABC transporter permease PstA [Lysobacter]UJB20825.1 phosphate ABC transporter permease PstA [Lysobacter capsici]UJQ30061.1 phosphate ABC transporter permease PstA [Lysobacter gummosus]